MNRKYPLSLISGILISYLVIFTSVNLSQNSPSFTYRNKKYYSDILNETRIIERENFIASFNVQSYWQVAKSVPYSGPTAIPYLVTFTINNKIDEVQWLDSAAEYYQVYIYNETSMVGKVIYVSDLSVEEMGLFLAPMGKHEIVSLWRGKCSGKYLPDGEYELICSFIIGGEMYSFDGVHFNVETRRVKEYNTVY